MKKILSVFLAVIMLLSTMAIGVSAADFKDTTNHWGAEYINYWTAENAVGGYQDGSFRPDNNVTRGEVAQIIAKILKLVPTSKTSPFKDMTEDAWYYEAIMACYDAGIFVGYPDKTIRANDTITREQAFVLISRITNVAPNASAANQFVDSKNAGTWATAAIGALVGAGVLDGYKTAAGTELRPKSSVTRAEFLKLLATVDKSSNISYTVGSRTPAEEAQPDQPIIIPAIVSSTTSTATRYKAKVDFRVEGAEVPLANEIITAVNENGSTPILADLFKFVMSKEGTNVTAGHAAANAEMKAIIALYRANGETLQASDLANYNIHYVGDSRDRGLDGFLGATYKSLGVGTYEFTYTEATTNTTYVATVTITKS